jgi:ATP-dependent helicase/nuclease subunit A
MNTDLAYELNGERIARDRFYAIACDPRRSVVVEACAGAGKTWMLVSRILRALLEGAQPHEVLAITFTKKAAGEMRQRLHEWLEAFASAPPGVLDKALIDRGLPAQPELREALKGLHARLLASGRPVQVRTFHSWFAALLRSAPLSVLEAL